MARPLRDGYAGGINRLFFYLSRYREAIEADLAFRGIDLNRLWRSRQWRKLLNLINHLPPNSHFNEALTGDREVMMEMHRIQEERREAGDGDERPLGPRVSQVDETARRLGEVITELRRLGQLVVFSSARSSATKPGNVQPYPQPVMRDGKTGDWIGKPSTSTLKTRHQHRVSLAQEAAERWKRDHGE